VSGLTYDTGALLAAEAGERRVWALHRRALDRGQVPSVPAGVLAQAWRGGPQHVLSLFLTGCAIDVLDENAARIAGALLGRAHSTDVVDATVTVGALARRDAVVTSDPGDVAALAGAVGRSLDLIPV
jgi:hypothetical protein